MPYEEGETYSDYWTSGRAAGAPKADYAMAGGPKKPGMIIKGQFYDIEALQRLAQAQVFQQFMQQYPQLAQGILPGGAQAGVDRQMALIREELNRRGVQGERQITSNLAARGMLRSNLYSSQVGDMNRQIAQQLGQSRESLYQQALQNSLAALGMGTGYQGNLAGQQIAALQAQPNYLESLAGLAGAYAKIQAGT